MTRNTDTAADASTDVTTDPVHLSSDADPTRFDEVCDQLSRMLDEVNPYGDTYVLRWGENEVTLTDGRDVLREFTPENAVWEFEAQVLGDLEITVTHHDAPTGKVYALGAGEVIQLRFEWDDRTTWSDSVFNSLERFVEAGNEYAIRELARTGDARAFFDSCRGNAPEPFPSNRKVAYMAEYAEVISE